VAEFDQVINHRQQNGGNETRPQHEQAIAAEAS
jgi:hypothetical protein